MNKLLLYARLSFMQLTKNKARFLLSVLGMILCIFIVGIAITLRNEAIRKIYEEAELYTENCFELAADTASTIWLEENVSMLSYKNAHKWCNNINKHYLEIEYDGEMTQLVWNTWGVEKEFTSYPVKSAAQFYTQNVSNTQLLYGRDINQWDINEKKEVAVIEKSIAILLFNKENAVGKNILISFERKRVNVEIIGIIEDLPYTKKQNYNLNRMLSLENEKEPLCANIYMPITLLERYGSGNDLQYTYVLETGGSNADNNKLKGEIITLNKNAGFAGRNISSTSKYDLIESARGAEEDLNYMLMIAVTAVIFVTGAVVLLLCLFAVKERVYEIGVRRALGASRLDILIQFVLEGALMGVVSGFFGVVLLIITTNFGSVILMCVTYNEMLLKVTIPLIMGLFGLAVLQGIVFTFIPALFAAEIQPTEAIRYD